MRKVGVRFPEDRTEGAENQPKTEVLEADRPFKEGDAVEIIRRIPGEIAARIDSKGVPVTGVLRFLQRHIIELSLRKGDKAARLAETPLDDLFRIDELMPRPVPVKPGQRPVAERMGAEFHVIGAHFPDLLPRQVPGPADEIGDQKNRAEHVVFAQNRIGVFIVVGIAVVKSNQHRLVGQIAAVHVIFELLQRNGVVAVVVKVLDLPFKIIGTHRQHRLKFIIDLVIIQYGHAGQPVIRGGEVPVSKDAHRHDRQRQHDPQEPGTEFFHADLLNIAETAMN